MSGVLTPDLKAYFDEARTWDQDRLSAARRSARLAWTVAAGASVLAAISVAAVFVLVPLKTVEPFVIRVDRATGAVAVMTGLSKTKTLTYEEAVTKNSLSTYVRARQTWMAPAARANFQQVSIMSTPDEQQRWADFANVRNPSSPQNIYGRGGLVEVDIRAISFVSPSVAAVRFHRTVRQGVQETESDWIATVGFTYTKAPMLESDRNLNPLGFQVTSYRADPEVVR